MLQFDIFKCQKHYKSFLSWQKIDLSEAFYPTCGYLEGRDGLLQAGYCLSVTTGTDLRVKGSHVEEDAGLLQ